MSPFQAACEAHAKVDGHMPRVTMDGQPMWHSYTGETAKILAAFLSAVKPANEAERACLDRLRDLAVR